MKKNLFYGRVSTQFSPYTLPFIKYTVTLFFFFFKRIIHPFNKITLVLYQRLDTSEEARFK